jgi:hypothetical protein
VRYKHEWSCAEDEDDDCVCDRRVLYGEEEIARPFKSVGALCPQEESTDRS